MSLKGWQWLKDGKVVMSYYFKDCTLYVWQDITEQDLDEFKAYLKDKHSEVFKIEYSNKIKGELNFLFTLLNICSNIYTQRK